jgi:serine/threonine-protein kinase SRK2
MRPYGRLEESAARWVFQQLVIGLDFCHRKGVANRDLKLENLLLDRDGRDGSRPLLKICDFGYSKHEMNSSARSGVGTPVYMAPEVILGESKYNAKQADIWSAGVILFAMLYGKYPFDAKQPNFPRKVVAADYIIPEDVAVSEGCKDLLTRLLVADPPSRMSIDEIKAHPWFLLSLPPGALDMNDQLMQTSADLREYHNRFDAIVEQAQHRWHPQEGTWVCSL